MNIILQNSFLSKWSCANVIKESIRLDLWERKPNDFYDNKQFTSKTALDHSKYLYDTLVKVTLKTTQILQGYYADQCTINRWIPGSTLGLHCDNMSEWPEEAPIHQHRAYGSILYLNDDFKGGNTYYPHFKTAINPKIGRLVIHPATYEYLHGMSEVKETTRYTISAFWTKDYNKRDKTIYDI